MAFDYKKEYKEFYMPKNKPGIVEVPSVCISAPMMMSQPR